MKCKNKGFTKVKGFTIVELVIVIAVIAILASVLVPTFSNVVKNANVSSDKSLVRNINNVLEIKGSLNQLPNDKTELRQVLKEYGINETKNKSKNHIIFWSKSQNMFFIWGIKEQEIIFPEYCRNKTLDDFSDEVNINLNEVKNMLETAISLKDPNNNGTLYVQGYMNGIILDGYKPTRVTDIGASDYVATGAMLIKKEDAKDLKIYIKGAAIDTGTSCKIHLFKESKVTEGKDIILSENCTITEWGLKVSKISDNYYVIECIDYDTYKTKSNEENVYYALSLFGSGNDLIITHNEEILDIN